jgi:apolipoprotein D and lipocalin family protein
MHRPVICTLLPTSLPALVLAFLSTSCATTTTDARGLPPLPTVADVKLERYLGMWFEVASFPQSFQRGCTQTTARYAQRPDGDIEVTNRCVVDDKEEIAVGRARLPDPNKPARLEVSFFGPFWADYWIVELGADYDYAVVGHPSRDYLWILSRKPTLDDATYADVLRRLEANGYETARLQKTAH